MKPDLQAKFLLHMTSKKGQDKGFTLIELLVVIIIIGILAAIALPSLLGQANKAKQSEAKQNTGSMNRAQQAFYLENSCFGTNVAELSLGIQTQTENYAYGINFTGTCPEKVINVGAAIPGKKTLKSYGGANVTLLGDAAISEALTIGTVCESKAPKQATAVSIAAIRTVFPLTDATVTNKKLECTTANWKNLGS